MCLNLIASISRFGRILVLSSEKAKFVECGKLCYERCISYLEKWFDYENSVFSLISVLGLNNIANINLNSVSAAANRMCVQYDGDALYDELLVLKSIFPLIDVHYSTDLKWAKFFQSNVNCPNLLRIVEACLALPISNAFVERIFSIMNNLWTDERNRLSTKMVKAEICIKLNFSMTCSEFYTFASSKKELLQAVKSNSKYSFKSKGD